MDHAVAYVKFSKRGLFGAETRQAIDRSTACNVESYRFFEPLCNAGLRCSVAHRRRPTVVSWNEL